MPRLLRMPGISADAEEVVFLEWCSTVGSTVAAGAAIATVETEKANVDIEAEEEAVLWRTLIEPGDAVAVGAPIAVLAGVGEDVSDEGGVLVALGLATTSAAAVEHHIADHDNIEEGDATAEPTATPTPAEANAPSPAADIGVDTPQANGRLFASPLARKLARDNNIALDSVVGTGPGGRIVRRDIDLAGAGRVKDHASPPSASQPREARGNQAVRGAEFVDIPHSGMRRAIARALTASKQNVPHFYLESTCRVESLLEMRQTINNDSQVRISINDFVLKAVGKALMDVPEMNVVWTDDAVRRFSTADVSVAVGGDHGLVTPVLRGVESMSLSQISGRVRDFVDRAGSGQLKQGELEGGSFSVSNLGMYAVERFAAIINPPQAGILAVGAVREEPVVTNGSLGVGSVLTVTLSADHRGVDGVVAATWLKRFTTLMENPALLLA
ncbi:MAG: dihydrolipoamide acetyltransferase family protein [Actinomycetota bacterium]|nr:dihydrolipoamide acetyltransferase family protein [Actinomycetota bacterium]MEC9129075.1 dihydrolipoamide acetyltransferase family protein [Actinomycetota bacterium]MED5345198.1 dihydrolipoamide acetyltransferase family protein [Actinomycetota bacterium]